MLAHIQPGRLADIVIWSPQFFGVKPKDDH